MSRSSRFLGHQLAAIAAKLTICLCIVFALTVLAVGQETTGGMKGYVKDKSGAVIAKAQLELTSSALLVPKKAETDGAGYFFFQQLPPGKYTLTVTSQNFRSYKQTDIPIEVGHLPSLDVVLEVGTVGEVALRVVAGRHVRRGLEARGARHRQDVLRRVVADERRARRARRGIRRSMHGLLFGVDELDRSHERHGERGTRCQ